MVKKAVLTQCRSCPWRVDCEPDKDIPGGYCATMHRNLSNTIDTGPDSLRRAFSGVSRVMACHYSPVGDEFPCAGWLHNQIGVGNNIGVRMAVISERLPFPEIDGPQHQRFEDTLPKRRR